MGRLAVDPSRVAEFSAAVVASGRMLAKCSGPTSNVAQDPALLAEALAELRLQHEELLVASEELQIQLESAAESALALELQRDRYRGVFDFAPDALCITNQRGVIQEVNGKMARLLDSEARFLQGKPFETYVRGADKTRFQRLLREVSTAGQRELTVTIHSRKGHETRVVLQAAQTSEPDRILWRLREDDSERATIPPPSMEAFDDLVAARTRMLRDARERESLLEEERKSREALEHADRARNQSFAILSHELRAPIQAILGWTQLFRHDDLDAAARERGLATIERNAIAQTKLIEMLVDLSRVTADKLQIVKSPVDLADIVEDVVDALLPQAKRKNITLTSELGKSVVVNGEASRLHQIATNLIVNALRYTPSGGSIQICVDQRDRIAQLSVTDTGRGISPEAVPRLFECFHQGDGGAPEGLGIGLYLVRKFVELHDGKITAESGGLGKGARFTVTLPAAHSRA